LFFLDSLPFAGSIVASRMLANWARRISTLLTVLHRTQAGMIACVLLLQIVLVLSAVTSRLSPLAFKTLGTLDALIWGALGVLTAALLGTYAVRTATTRE